MANSSATGGYLIPSVTPSPAEDLALEDIMQPAIAGITGISGANVRPRFQEGNPKIPDQSVDWCAFSITMQTPDANPYLKHDPAGNGKTTMVRHEDFELFISFYGYNAAKNATRLRDGFYINQNSEVINAQQIAFIDAGEIRLAPELVNQKWIRRNDLRMKFRRKIERDYAIENILLADVQLLDDTGHVNELIVISE
jgi:hypothetical protein